MRVIVNKDVLEDVVTQLVTEDRSIRSTEINSIPAKDEEEPIVPIPQMATQLSADAPPVEDPDYIPASIVALGRAAAVLAAEVPSDQIEFYYRKLHELLDAALDRHDANFNEESYPEEDTNLFRAQEDFLKESIRRLIENEDDETEMSGEEADVMYRPFEIKRDPLEVSLDKATDVFLNKPRKYITDIYLMPIKMYDPAIRGMAEYNFEVGFSKMIEEAPVIADAIIADSSIDPAHIESVKKMLIVYLSAFLKDPASVEPDDILIGDAHRMVEALYKKTSDDPEKFIRELKQVRMAVEDNPEKELYVLLIGYKYYQRMIEALEPKEEEYEEYEEESLYQSRAGEKGLDVAAEAFGFKNASGIRQWYRKFAAPKFRMLLGGDARVVEAYTGFSDIMFGTFEVLVDSAVDALPEMIAQSTGKEKNQLEALLEGLMIIQEEALSDDGIDPETLEGEPAGHILRYMFADLVLSPVFRELPKHLKNWATSYLRNKGITDQGGVFAKMLNGETEPPDSINDPGAKAKKLRERGVTQAILRQALIDAEAEGHRYFGGEGSREEKRAHKKSVMDRYLNVINNETKVKTAITKAVDQFVSDLRGMVAREQEGEAEEVEAEEVEAEEVEASSIEGI